MRKRMRKLAPWLVLLAVVGGGWWGYRVTHPVLAPVVTRRLPMGAEFLFSMNGMGYPAAQTRRQAPPREAVILDELCRPIPGDAARLPFCRVSPHRRVFVSMDETDPTMHDVAERTADGRLTRRQWHTRDRYVAPYGLTDNGVVFASFGRIIYPGGREAKVALPNWSSNGCTYDCADPRYIAVDDGGKLTLVEVTKSPPALLKIPVDNRPGWIVPGMVFVHGTRILTVPSSGEATVMEKGMVLATLGEFGLTECTVSSRWWWGEDGTVWERSSDDTYHLLQWRTGRPRLTALRGPATLDDSVDDYTPLPFLLTDRAIALQPYAPALAAWGDERLVATTETTLRIPERLEKLVRRLFGALPPSEHFRVLTLTRDGKRVGTYTARMGKPMTNRLALYQEHLAFTEDGRHLSWVLESARGVEVYVFRTGR